MAGRNAGRNHREEKTTWMETMRCAFDGLLLLRTAAHLGFLDANLRSIFQNAGHDAEWSADHFVAFLDARLDFKMRRIADAGFNRGHLDRVAIANENDALQSRAILALALTLLLFIHGGRSAFALGLLRLHIAIRRELIDRLAA